MLHVSLYTPVLIVSTLHSSYDELTHFGGNTLVTHCVLVIMTHQFYSDIYNLHELSYYKYKKNLKKL